MIIDTSALVATLRQEAGFDALLDAMIGEGGMIPTPVIVELARVIAGPGNTPHQGATLLTERLQDVGCVLEPFSVIDAQIAASTNAAWGSGNGKGGTLNMLDLMVYAMAKRLDLPILCTGRDFTTTDAKIHPASRRD